MTKTTGTGVRKGQRPDPAVVRQSLLDISKRSMSLGADLKNLAAALGGLATTSVKSDQPWIAPWCPPVPPIIKHKRPRKSGAKR